ncbi:15234_t:CDS:2 [Entrophospora sp. SA101]|nr:15234_t:CDS:2 [Entrophospora sp. SA101]
MSITNFNVKLAALKALYNVEVCQWIFLEPGEAKTTIDSHHKKKTTLPGIPN